MSVKSQQRYPKKLIIGTRGSDLALWQAHKVRDEMARISPDVSLEIRVINTSGDWRPEQGEVPLEAVDGGKAQFAKELEEALLAGEIDIAVHSMKDMEANLPQGLVIPFMLPREDPRDAFLSNNAQNIDDLSAGSVVGTVSVRRQAFLLHARPDIKVVPFRGNVQTRIDKLNSGQVDATFLACAGLNRLGMSQAITSVIDIEDMLPSVGQGAVGVEMRGADVEFLSFIGQISCIETVSCVFCERGVLRALNGSCHTPVGVYSTLNKGEMHLRVKVVAPDGSQMWEADERARIETPEEATQFGERIGARLKVDVPDGIL